MKLVTHLHLALRLRIRGALLFAPTSLWRVVQLRTETTFLNYWVSKSSRMRCRHACTYSKHGGTISTCRILIRKLKKTDHLEDLGVDGTIIIQFLLEKWVVMIWKLCGIASDESKRKRIFWVPYQKGMFRSPEWLSIVQAKLCALELIGRVVIKRRLFNCTTYVTSNDRVIYQGKVR
jgi:hypothetical protein